MNKSQIRPLSLLSISNIVAAAIAFVSLPISLRAAGPEGFSKLVVAQSTALLCYSITDFQVWRHVLTASEEFGGHFTRFSDSIRLELRLVAAAIALYLVSYFLLAKEADRILWILSVGFIPAMATSSINALLRLEERYGLLAVSIVIPAVARLLALLILKPSKAEQLVAIYVATDILKFLPVFSLRKLTSAILTPRKLARRHTFQWASTIVDIPINFADKLLLGSLLNPDGLSSYYVLRRVGTVFGMITGPISMLMIPEISKLNVEKNKDQLGQYLRRYVSNSLPLITTATIAVVIGYPLAKEVAFPGLTSISKSIWAAHTILQAVLFISVFLHPLVVAQLRKKLELAVTLSANTALILAILIFVPSNGLAGAVVALALQISVTVVAKLYFTRDVWVRSGG